MVPRQISPCSARRSPSGMWSSSQRAFEAENIGSSARPGPVAHQRLIAGGRGSPRTRPCCGGTASSRPDPAAGPWRAPRRAPIRAGWRPRPPPGAPWSTPARQPSMAPSTVAHSSVPSRLDPAGPGERTGTCTDADATTRPAASTSSALVFVVPWSMARRRSRVTVGRLHRGWSGPPPGCRPRPARSARAGTRRSRSARRRPGSPGCASARGGG